METEIPFLIASAPTTALDSQRSSDDGRHVSLSDYWALTKPEVNFLIVIATFTGFCLGSPGPPDHVALVWCPRNSRHRLLGGS